MTSKWTSNGIFGNCEPPGSQFPETRLERSRSAADASREVVERWLLDGLM
jgi:hypothetical protein